jgi:hypothetical protein
MKAHVVKGQVPLLFFLLAAHFSEAVAAAAGWATRNPLLLDIGHAVVEQVFGGELSVDLDEHAIGGLALAGVARYGIAVIEMRVRGRVNIYDAAVLEF